MRIKCLRILPEICASTLRCPAKSTRNIVPGNTSVTVLSVTICCSFATREKITPVSRSATGVPFRAERLARDSRPHLWQLAAVMIAFLRPQGSLPQRARSDCRLASNGRQFRQQRRNHGDASTVLVCRKSRRELDRIARHNLQIAAHRCTMICTVLREQHIADHTRRLSRAGRQAANRFLHPATGQRSLGSLG
jgi:hypothetical protein